MKAIRFIGILCLTILSLSACKKDEAEINDLQQPYMEFTTALNAGEKMEIVMDAAPEDRANIWVDLNNNGIRESGEDVTVFDNREITYTFSGNRIFTIYGKVSKLHCGYSMKLIHADVSKNSSLTYLTCYGEQLVTINASNNTGLKELSCTNNPNLESIWVSGCTNLETLRCSGGGNLRQLQVDKCTSLKFLDLIYNKIESLDVSTCMNLKELHCNSNNLSTIKFGENKALEKLDCAANQIKYLEIEGLSSLKELNCSINYINSGSMTVMIMKLPNGTSNSKKATVRRQSYGENNATPTITDISIAASKGWQLIYN